MMLWDYMKDKLLMILINGIGLFLLSLYLGAVGNNGVTIGFITGIWILGFLTYLFYEFYSRKRYFDRIFTLMEELDKPYLVQECMENSQRLEDQLYREILRRSNKAVIEQIYQLEKEQKEYREFIEGWIHEVKLPITSIRLASHQGGSRRNIEGYLTELEHDVEQALFYARSDQVYKDYMIRSTELKTIVLKLLRKNKFFLIQNNMTVNVELEDLEVYSDAKWLEFILEQILINAVKYKKEEGGEISFYGKDTGKTVYLVIQDNGIGIPEAELSRMFEKGFTGSNGRNRMKSTGIGLYLCKKLCQKLGLEIRADSKEGEYTKLTILFPKHSFLSKL